MEKRKLYTMGGYLINAITVECDNTIISLSKLSFNPRENPKVVYDRFKDELGASAIVVFQNLAEGLSPESDPEGEVVHIIAQWVKGETTKVPALYSDVIDASKN